MPNENDDAPTAKGPPASLTDGEHFPKTRPRLLPEVHNLA